VGRKDRGQEEVDSRKMYGREVIFGCDVVQFCGGRNIIIRLLAYLLFRLIGILQQNHDFCQ
jgi:hypothetical protein